jgi:hypothetical protein
LYSPIVHTTLDSDDEQEVGNSKCPKASLDSNMQEKQTPTPPRYLLRHFRVLVKGVLSQEPQLLQSNEVADLQALLALPEEALFLFTHLLDRRAVWHELSTLNNTEITDIHLARHTLQTAGRLSTWPNADEAPTPPPEDLLKVLSVKQCRSLLHAVGLSTSGSKWDLTERLRNQYETKERSALQGDLWGEVPSVEGLLASMGTWVLLHPTPTVGLAKVLFFGNTRQDLVVLLLNEIKVQRFESLALCTGSPFSSRLEALLMIEASDTLDDLREKMDLLLATLRHWKAPANLERERRLVARSFLSTCWLSAQSLESRINACFADDAMSRLGETQSDADDEPQDRAQRRHMKQKLLRMVARYLRLGITVLERMKRYKAALVWIERVIALDDKPSTQRVLPRLLLDLEHLGRKREAEVRRKEILAESNDAQKELGRGFSESVDPLLREQLVPSPPSDFTSETLHTQRHLGWQRGKTVVQTPSGAALCVEDFALDHYTQLGWKGIHQENALIPSLTGLIFWHLLFHKRGQFHHTWQAAPQDWGELSFLESRQDLFEAILNTWPKKLGTTPHSESQLNHLRERIIEKEGMVNPLVRWAAFRTWPNFQEALEALCSSLTRSGLEELARPILRDPHRMTKGMPDLFLWKEGKVCFLEVKGPGDQLSAGQRFWLKHLKACGLDAKVLRVKTKV